MFHVRKISLYFLKGDLKEDYIHDQIIKVVDCYKKACSKVDLQEVVVFYRDLLGFLKIQSSLELPSGFLNWIQDYTDLAKEVAELN